MYASRVESQLIGAENLEIRIHVDSAYEKITTSIFESLKQMARLDGEGEDKNHHIILIGETHLSDQVIYKLTSL